MRKSYNVKMGLKIIQHNLNDSDLACTSESAVRRNQTNPAESSKIPKKSCKLN